MRNKTIVLLTLVVCLFATAALAGGLKERMRARLPEVRAMLAQGVVGENSQGFLEFRAAPQKQDVVNGQNADRAAVYDAIAKKNGTTAVLVGQRRAAQIAAKAAPGTWLQSPDGKWYKK